MEDKEVGELWRQAQDEYNEFPSADIRQLIRKLVEERARAHDPRYGRTTGEFLTNALRDFGISENDYVPDTDKG